MAQRRTGRLDGWWIVAAATLGVGGMLAVVFALHGGDREGVSAGIRWTARSSLACFLLAFVASALVALRPSPASRWLLRNRRYLGLSLAVSHGAHAALIAVLAARHPAFFETDVSQLGGGLGYLMLLAMTLTSSDRAVAWLGRRRWRALHLTGMYTLWVIFTFSYLTRTLVAPAHAPALGLLLGAVGLRALAWRRRRARREARTSLAA